MLFLRRKATLLMPETDNPLNKLVMSLVLKDVTSDPRYAHLCKDKKCVIITYIIYSAGARSKRLC